MIDSEVGSTFYNSVRSAGTHQGQKIPLQVDEVLKCLGLGAAPMVYAVSRLPKKKIGDDTDYWDDDQIFPEWTTVTANAVAMPTQGSNVVWTVADGTLFTEWQLWYHEASGKVIQVQNVSGNAVTVDGLESTGVPAVTSGDVLQRLLVAMDEGGGYPNALSTRETRFTNYIQFNRDTIQLTDVAMSADDYHGGKGADYKLQKRKKNRELLNALERSFWRNGEPILGAPDTGLDDPADTTRNRGKFMGYDYYLENHAPAANIATELDLTKGELFDWAEVVTQFANTSEYWIMADPNFALALEYWYGDKIRFTYGDKKAGLAFTTLMLPNGVEAKVMLNQQLRAMGTNPYHYVYLIQWSAENFKHVYFNDFDYQYSTDEVKDGNSRQVDIVRNYCCFEFRLAPLHGRMRYKTYS